MPVLQDSSPYNCLQVACTNWKRVMFVLSKNTTEPYRDPTSVPRGWIHETNELPMLKRFPKAEWKVSSYCDIRNKIVICFYKSKPINSRVPVHFAVNRRGWSTTPSSCLSGTHLSVSSQPLETSSSSAITWSIDALVSTFCASTATYQIHHKQRMRRLILGCTCRFITSYSSW